MIDPRGAEPVEHRGSVPAGAIVVPGSRAKEFPAGTYGMPCGLIIGDRTEATDDKVALNDLLRELRLVDGLSRMPRPHPTTRIVESPIAATWRSIQHEKAVLVGIGPGIAEDDLDELAALADSAGAEPVGRIVQSRERTRPAVLDRQGEGRGAPPAAAHDAAPSWWSSTRSSRPGTCARSRRGSASRWSTGPP